MAEKEPIEDACDKYNPDICERFEVVEFPKSFVDLESSTNLDVGICLDTSAIIKTTYENKLMRFEEAQLSSAAHAAFIITKIENHVLNIKFKPTKSCVFKAKKDPNFQNKFVIDLCLEKIDEKVCCNNEKHWRIGRFFLVGEVEFLQITHHPHIVRFGTIVVLSKGKQYVTVTNKSSKLSAKFEYIKRYGIEVTPAKCLILPDSSKELCITVIPTTLVVADFILFKIENPNDHKNTKINSTDFITYTMRVSAKIIYNKPPKQPKPIESLHKICEKDTRYAYTDDELVVVNSKKEIAKLMLEEAKVAGIKRAVPDRDRYKLDYYSKGDSIIHDPKSYNICKPIVPAFTSYDITGILFNPYLINYGRISTNTYGHKSLFIENKTQYQICIKFCKHKYIRYTSEKRSKTTLKILPFAKAELETSYHGFSEGAFEGFFEFVIEDLIRRDYPYKVEVRAPVLWIQESSIKFGMISNENFTTSVAIRIYNHYNIPVNFSWEGMNSEIPFEIIPMSGCIPDHSCRLCDILYHGTNPKSKVFEIFLHSQSTNTTIIPVELNIITRKTSVKFLQPNIILKDIPLNLEINKNVALENSSRELVHFHIPEVPLAGMEVEPITGVLAPKSVVSMKLILKLPCVMDFACDLVVRINNKENVLLSLSGNVVEPKISISPKHLILPRTPAYLITYVPITFQNTGLVKSIIEILELPDHCGFDVFFDVKNEKIPCTNLVLEGGTSKTLYVKVCDTYRREFDLYLPIKINGILGPVCKNVMASFDFQHFTKPFEEIYVDDPKIKLKTICKEISYFRLSGVITLPWIEFSVDSFLIEYKPYVENAINFQIKNVSIYSFQITIVTSKITPNFTLTLISAEEKSIVTENQIKFCLNPTKTVTLKLLFHPKGQGSYTAVAPMFLDKNPSINYANLTFIGKRIVATMTASCSFLIFPVCDIEEILTRQITLTLEKEAEFQSFSYTSRDDQNINVKFLSTEYLEDKSSTILNVLITVACKQKKPCTAKHLLTFHNENGAMCDVELCYTFAKCPITLHANRLVECCDNPYPYFPSSNQTILFNYMEECLNFLERWMYIQGFRKELYPTIPDTLHTISEFILSSHSTGKSKGLNVSYMHFIRRIAGPLMKNLKKVKSVATDEPFKTVKEIHDNYKEIVYLLKSRGSELWGLDAKYLLSFSQYNIFIDNVTLKSNSDILLSQELTSNEELYNRLNKQCWIDFILQTYKVFVVETCFFACVCNNLGERDIITILVEWYRSVTIAMHSKFRKDQEIKAITNITTDLSDGIALTSALLCYCPFLMDHFSAFSELHDNDEETVIINNACLIIEALHLIRIQFPIRSKEFLKPNYIQMIFLSINLYISLPMFNAKKNIEFDPPLLKRSIRNMTISTQDSLITHLSILYNHNGCFTVEKSPDCEHGRKICLTVKFKAKFLAEEKSILLIHGYNKTRLFDAYIVFQLKGKVGSMAPFKKCKVFGTMYQQCFVDIFLTSPFSVTATFKLSLSNKEPTLPLAISNHHGSFHFQRLQLIEEYIVLNAVDSNNDTEQDKIRLSLICLSTQVGNSYLWLRSNVGEFYVKIMTQPRWDVTLDVLQIGYEWPVDPCACGEECLCYRTTVLRIPHRNEAKVRALRMALAANKVDRMLQVYDEQIISGTGRMILQKLLFEGKTDMVEVNHILNDYITYTIFSRTLILRTNKVVMSQHSNEVLTLPITLPANDKSEKHTLTLTSECGLDIRTYKVIFNKQLLSISNKSTDESSSKESTISSTF